MKVSFEGIGEVAVTCFAAETLAKGDVVKMTGNATVGVCVANDGFCGVAMNGMEGGTAAVQMGGCCTVKYSGTAPTVGWTKISADGAKGVKADATATGTAYLILSVDTAAKTAVIRL
ncbi:MAG: hypothetical protein RR807_03900 [Oscillospiraceae bacterium]